MSFKMNLIISLILIILIIIYEIIQVKKNKTIYERKLYNKSKKLIKILYLLSFILFFISLLVNIFTFNTNPTNKEFATFIINAISIALLICPLSLTNLYRISFKDEEKYSHIKTIITNIYDLNIIKKLKKAGINTIIINKNISNTKIPTIKENEINKSHLKKTLIIESDNKNILDKLLNNQNTIKEFTNLETLYNKIYNSRGVHDNYIRTIKYLIITYLSLILSYIFLSIMGFPVIYNLLLVLILKTITILTSNYLYRKMPYDNDIAIRKVKDENIFIGKQEILITILTSFIVFFVTNIPYMFTLAQGASTQFANTLFILLVLYSNLFITISLLSESNIFINIFKSLKNIRMILFILLCVIITIVINKTSYFDTKNIALPNIISCILFGFIPCLFNELSKLARFTTQRGVKKNGTKNNKKYKRS